MRLRPLTGTLAVAFAVALSAPAGASASDGEATSSARPKARIAAVAPKPAVARQHLPASARTFFHTRTRKRGSRRAGSLRRQPRRAVGAQAPGTTPVDTGAPWATVNLCDTPERPGAMGIRAYVPSRGGKLDQWMRIRVQWFSTADNQWHAVRTAGETPWERVGMGASDVEAGYTFTFQLPSADHRLLMRGVVDMEWRRGDRVRARDKRMTEIGHADPADPLRLDSRADCQVER